MQTTYRLDWAIEKWFLIVLIGLMVDGPHGSYTRAQQAEDSPGDWPNPDVQKALQSDDLTSGIIAYTQGDYANALTCLERAAPNLEGDVRQEVQIKIGLCYLMQKDFAKGTACLESVRQDAAGGRGSVQADQLLQRLWPIQQSSKGQQESLLRAEYLLSVGAVHKAQEHYSSLVNSATSDEIKAFAKSRSVVLEATELAMHGRFDEVSDFVKKETESLSSTAMMWPTVLEVADIANSRIDGSIDEVFSRIESVERLINHWQPDRYPFPDETTRARFHYVLSNLYMHRLHYANQIDSGRDNLPLIEAALFHLERSLEITQKSSPALHAAVMGDLIDVYLMANQYRHAADLAKLLYEQFPTSPLVPEAWLKIGIAHRNVSNIQRAREWFADVLINFPGTLAAIQAKQYMDKLHLSEPSDLLDQAAYEDNQEPNSSSAVEKIERSAPSTLVAPSHDGATSAAREGEPHEEASNDVLIGSTTSAAHNQHAVWLRRIAIALSCTITVICAGLIARHRTAERR